MEKRILIITANNCSKCLALKKLMKEKGIEVDELDSGSGEGRTEVLLSGKFELPIVKIDYDYFGFDEFIKKMKEVGFR